MTNGTFTEAYPTESKNNEKSTAPAAMRVPLLLNNSDDDSDSRVYLFLAFDEQNNQDHLNKDKATGVISR